MQPMQLKPHRFHRRLLCYAANFLSGVDRQPRPASAMHDHLPALFLECAGTAPKLVMELGTQGGASTRALTSAAALFAANVVSVDIDDCSSVCDYGRWEFVHADDVQFAARFPEWCRERGIEPSIDFLFMDTSHFFDHTVKEISAWFPHLAPRCRVAFHDTNLRYMYRMRSGQYVLSSYDNERGVIRAIEDYLHIRVNENRPFTIYTDEWKVSHVPYCSGFTVLERNGRSLSANHGLPCNQSL